MDALPLLLNQSAGRGPRSDGLAQAAERAAGETRVEVVAPGELEERLVALRGSPRVAVAGGDGTMQTAAGVLRGSRTALIPVPAGHLNHFARRLGIDTPDAAAAAAAGG